MLTKYRRDFCFGDCVEAQSHLRRGHHDVPSFLCLTWLAVKITPSLLQYGTTVSRIVLVLPTLLLMTVDNLMAVGLPNGIITVLTSYADYLLGVLTYGTD